jgi:hypothetical protein
LPLPVCKNLVFQTFQTDQDKKQALLEAEQEKLRGKKNPAKNKFKNSAEIGGKSIQPFCDTG